MEFMIVMVIMEDVAEDNNSKYNNNNANKYIYSYFFLK